jgi:hypothetical protein
MGKKDNALVAAVASETPGFEKPLHFHLGALQIALSSSSPLVGRFARQFLSDWISRTGEAAKTADIQIYLELVESLPPLPEQEPIFASSGRHLPDGVGTLSVYELPEGFLLYFRDGGLVRIKPEGREQLIHGFVTTRLLQYSRLHDLLFTTLSPFLRRRGCYLVHAAAAVYAGEAAIFAGPPGCGKSTTVLNLTLNGWTVLSDDTLLLEERPNGIYALPTPGGFSIRPETVRHLPLLAAHVTHPLPEHFNKLSLPKMGLDWANPAPISTIYFPEISQGQGNEQFPLPPAIALARLLELSLDRWDTTHLPAHITFLERLSRQAQAISLKITNQQQIPSLIMRHW